MIWFYTLVSVFIISLISFVGVIYIFVKKDKLENFLLYMVAFSAGAMFGGVFLHLLPELSSEFGLTFKNGLIILAGILLFFVIEKFVHWHHCHRTEHHHKIKPMAYTNLIGDGFHNFLDGVLIAGAFLVSPALGFVTTMAVAFHEIPQEIGDVGVLLYAGFSKTKALLFNFLSACFAVVGAILTLILAEQINGLNQILISLAAGGFIYIAGSDLIPELHKECSTKNSFINLLMIIFGISIMALLLFLN